MTRIPTIFIMGAIIFVFCASAGASPDFTGEVSVGSAAIKPGEQAAIPIYLQNNNIEIASLTVPLKYSSPDVEIDSISFTGSLLKSGMTPLVQIDNGSRFCRFTYYPSLTEEITETEGLLATVHITAKASAPEQTVAVDSVNALKYAGPPEVWVRIEFTDTTGTDLFFPSFAPGEITVLPPMDADDDQFSLPGDLELKQNFPNPFNPATTISFSLPERSHVRLTIYNILGQEVETLVDEVKNPGVHNIRWEASDKASGIYFYRLFYDERVLTKKMALLK